MNDETLLQIIVCFVFLLAGIILILYSLYEKSKRPPPEEYLPNHLLACKKETRKEMEENMNEQKEAIGVDKESTKSKDQSKSTENVSTTLLSRIPFSMLPFGYRNMGRLQQDKNVFSQNNDAKLQVKGNTPKFGPGPSSNPQSDISEALAKTFNAAINEATNEVAKQEKAKEEQEKKRKEESERERKEREDEYKKQMEAEAAAKAAEEATATKKIGLGTKTLGGIKTAKKDDGAGAATDDKKKSTISFKKTV